MEQGKTPGKPQGNLRDFRIDGNHAASPSPLRPAPPRAVEAPVKQHVKARTFAKISPTPNPLARSLTPADAIHAPSKADALPAIRTAPTRPAPVLPPRSNVAVRQALAPATVRPAETPRRAPALMAVPAAAKSWSLTDSSPAADEDNLWGHWKNDADAASVDLSRPSSPATELLSVEDLRDEQAARAHAPQARPAIPTQRIAPLGNLQEVQSDEHEEVAQEKQKLLSENFGKHPWAVELALSERKAERLGVVDYANGFQKHEILKMRTLEFTARLHAAFREQVELFNASRKSASSAVQLYKINNTAEDFMLFRNGIKLVVSGQQAGRLIIAFNQFMGQIYNGTQAQPTVEISAVWGPFEHLIWQHKGERVHSEDIVRHFLTEFVRQSFR